MTTDFLIGAIRASRDLHPLVKTDLEEILEEPHVMTLDELKNLPHYAVVWEERKDDPQIRPMIVSREKTLIDEDGEVKIREGMLDPKPMFFGEPRICRYWNKKPERQRAWMERWA